MDITSGSNKFNNLNRVNILLGKNGAGKSTILKTMRSPQATTSGQAIYSEYITPERGGFLTYEAGIDTAISSPGWLSGRRNSNQTPDFKQQTIARYRNLKEQVLETIEENLIRDSSSGSIDPISISGYSFFQTHIDAINSLLENIEIKRNKGKAFSIYKKGTDILIDSNNISSGESELISLAIECIYFQKINNGQEKILLLDEPDVHLHPDLQVKFMRFIHALVTEVGSEFRVVIATHSTAFLGALEDTNDVAIAFMLPSQTTIDFKPITEIYKEFLPVFGAHPLSNIFNEAPVLLVEGEDDERIWQQAVRTSLGAIKLYPCVCGDVSRIAIFENEIKTVIESIYNDAKAYSLRDRDDTSEADLADDLPIIKHKLRCYSAENLLLTDEVLASLGHTWEELKIKMDEWIIEKGSKLHPQLEDMKAFQIAGYERKDLKIKTLRLLILGIMGVDKPWEVIVGKTIAGLRWNVSTDFTKEGSIYNFLGEKLVKGLLPKA